MHAKQLNKEAQLCAKNHKTLLWFSELQFHTKKDFNLLISSTFYLSQIQFDKCLLMGFFLDFRESEVKRLFFCRDHKNREKNAR